MSVIFWDFDGTLVKSNPLWSGSVFTALRETCAGQNNSLNVKFEDIRRYMAFGFTWHTPQNDYTAFKNEKWWEFMNRHIYKSYISLGVDSETAAAATQKVRSIIKRTENYTLYDDAVSTLDALKTSGNKNIILSNNYPELIEVIRNLKLDKYFDAYVISAQEGYDKPRKELFEIAKSYNTNNEPMFMVGDNANADVIGGNNAGMITVFVHNGYCKEAAYCTDTLSAIPKIISKNKAAAVHFD